MRILVTNDDGPPSNQSSPYVHSLVDTLQAAGHSVSVVLPHTQRSWIGKAHIVGQTLTPTYFRPGTLHEDDGVTAERPFHEEDEEWVLIDGTPASCVQIGLHHVFKDQTFDVVVSGPNYGRNTTAVFALSSGTLGGAMEGAMSGMKSIGLSYAFDSREHDPEIIAAASKLSTKLIEKLVREWPEDVHLYSINVPLRKGVESAKILYTEMLQNRWLTGSSFEEVPLEEENHDPNEEEVSIRQQENENAPPQKPRRRAHGKFKWSPNFADIRKAVTDAQRGDGWEILQGNVTVTPLVANFWHLPHYTGEIKLDNQFSPSLPIRSMNSIKTLNALVAYPDDYVQPLILEALESLPGTSVNHIKSLKQLQSSSDLVLQFSGYEDLDFDHVLEHPKTSLACAYVIRKALIRKHYLSNTISTWLVKHPESPLTRHFKPCVHFELDYAEFLDDALVDAWDLNESMARNEQVSAGEKKEWWILKPGMSDGGNGIRLFSSLEQLQSIFEEWEEASDSEPESESESEVATTASDTSPSHAQADTDYTHRTTSATAMTSQLRHFIAQPYIAQPLLLDSHDRRKFHIRTYIVAVGALKVYVYREMLALFAAVPYAEPSSASTTDHPEPDTINLAQHLTNTCFQSEDTKSTSVHSFWELEMPTVPTTSHGQSPTQTPQEKIFSQICNVTSTVFEAAAREQMVHFQTLPNAFEIFGADFLVDDQYNVWLLELNAYPDFKQTGAELKDKIVGGLFRGVVDVAVGAFVRGPSQPNDRVDGSIGSDYKDRNEDKDSTRQDMVLVADLHLGRG